jgi:hypothetical protein
MAIEQPAYKRPNLTHGNRLAIELGTELYLDISGLGQHLKSALIGMEAGKFFIIRIPQTVSPTAVMGALVPNTRAVVRYLYHGIVFGFETHIIQATMAPIPLLLLAYPKEIAEKNIRKFRRINCFLPAVININEQTIEGTITDISSRGCNWHAKREKLGNANDLLDGHNMNLILDVQLPGIEDVLRLQGQERSVRKDDSMIDVGIEFTELDQQHHDTLTAFIKTAEELS